VLPEVPALGEIMPEFKRPETSHALLAPAGTPRAVIDAINRDIAKALEQHDIKGRLQGIAFVTAPTTPDECDRILRSQIETLAGVVRDAGLKPR
jgi:tripartite-type tricarboxylate transporter receptor subunit TctC